MPRKPLCRPASQRASRPCWSRTFADTLFRGAARVGTPVAAARASKTLAECHVEATRRCVDSASRRAGAIQRAAAAAHYDRPRPTGWNGEDARPVRVHQPVNFPLRRSPPARSAPRSPATPPPLAGQTPRSPPRRARVPFSSGIRNARAGALCCPIGARRAAGRRCAQSARRLHQQPRHARAIQRSLATRRTAGRYLLHRETGGSDAAGRCLGAARNRRSRTPSRRPFAAGRRCSAARLLPGYGPTPPTMSACSWPQWRSCIGDPDDLATDVNAAAVAAILTRQTARTRARLVPLHAARQPACAAASSRRCQENSGCALAAAQGVQTLLHVMLPRRRPRPRHRRRQRRRLQLVALTSTHRQGVRACSGASAPGSVYIEPLDHPGAVVGTQPFGGSGLSGTGPKAGGPHYHSAVPRARGRISTTAAGIDMTDDGGLKPGRRTLTLTRSRPAPMRSRSGNRTGDHHRRDQIFRPGSRQTAIGLIAPLRTPE